MFHYVFGSGWSSSDEAELSFVSSWDGMMVSWPAIIMSIVRLSLMSMVVVSVRNLGRDPAAPGPRVWSFSLSTSVASRAVWSLQEEEVRRGEVRGRENTLKWKIVQRNLTTNLNLNYEMYKIYKHKPCMFIVYIIFIHADCRFTISRILHAPTQNDESFPTIWCWNIWTKMLRYSPPPAATLHRRQQWMPTFIWHSNVDTERTFRHRNAPELLRAWKPILTSI